MSSERKEYKVGDCAKKAARFFVACKANSDTRVKVTEVMQVRGYSNWEAANLKLQMQVRCTIKKKGGSHSLPRGSGRPHAAGPVACGNCSKAGAENNHAKSGNCSCSSSGWGF
jgi:hypothetical protein